MRQVVVKMYLALFVCMAVCASMMHCIAKHDLEEEVVTSEEAVLQYWDLMTWLGLQDEFAMFMYPGKSPFGHHIQVDLSPGQYLVIPHIPMSQTAFAE